jgi:hypothetical protein
MVGSSTYKLSDVCRETNPPAINIKREKDKQAQIMNIAPPVRNVSIQDINLVLLRKKERLSEIPFDFSQNNNDPLLYVIP